MPDVFDEISIEQTGDIFDQVEQGPVGDVFDQVEVAEDEETGSYVKQLLGSFVKGGMRLGQAVLQMPEHAMWLAAKVGGIRTDRPPEPGEPGYLLYKDLQEKPTLGRKLGEFHMDMIERHKRGTQRIIENHPEWDYEPPENFVDLLTSPRKLSLVIAESTPVFVAAGVMTAGGRPDVGLAMMYATEGQDAYDQAIADGATTTEAETAYHLYGSVASVLEFMQLKGIFKIGKGTFNAVLASTAKKIAGQGLKSITLDIIKVAAKEAIEEITQGAWQEATAKIVYDKSIPGGLWGFIDRRAQDGLVGFAMGVIPGVGGAGGAAIQARFTTGLVSEQLPKIDEAKTIIEESPDLTPEQKEVGLRYIGDIETQVINEIVDRFPGEINNQESLERIGNQIAEHLGIDVTRAGQFTGEKGVNWVFSKRKSKTMYGQLIGSNKLIIYSGNTSEQVKKTIVHELGHIEKPTQKIYLSPQEKQEWRERGVSEERLDKMFKRRKIHHPEFKQWVEENVKQLSEEISRVEPIPREEAIGPVEVGPVEGGPIKAASIEDKQKAIAHLMSLADTERAVGNLEAAEKLDKRAEELQAEIIGVKPVAEPTPPKPAKLSRKKALTLGHQLPKKMGWDDAQRRDFMQELVGKASMKGMTPKEMRTVVEALQSQARDMGVLPAEDYQKRMWIGTREVDTGEYIDAALEQVEALPDLKGTEPEVVTRRAYKRKRGLVSLAKDILVGVDNLSIPHLMRKIGGIKEGPIKEVGVDGWRRNIHRVASVFRGAVTQLNEAFDVAKITPKDLAEMSRSLDPRMELIKRGREIIGKPKTKTYTFEINGKQYQLSMGELLDVYLCAQQEKGLAHITQKGLNIFGVRTGPIDETTLKALTDAVDKDQKAKVFVYTVVKIGEEYNAPQLNYTNSRLNPEAAEQVADEKNYWHLDVETVRRIVGKGTYQVSFLENKGILKPRTKATGALVVRDAFPKFFSVQYAVAEYVGMAEELRAINLLLNYEPIVNQLEKKGYKGIRNNIKQLVEWVQDKRSTTVRADALLSKILHGSFRAVLHYSPEVIASQYMSTGHYAGVTPVKYHHLLLTPPGKSTIKEMLEHNDVVWMRYYAGGQSAELAEVGQLDVSLRLLTGTHADLNKSGIAAQTTDLFAFAQGWKIAKAIVSDTTDLKPGTVEFFDAVNDKVEELWDTQPSWDKWNKSINTSQRGIKRLPFLFRSYFEKSLMMLHTANETYRVSEKTAMDKAKKAQVYGAVMGSQMATALIRTFIGWAIWRQRKTVWDYIAAMLAAPFVMVSIVGGYLNRIVGNVVRILAGQKQAYEGEPISSLPTKTIEQFFLGIGQMVDAAAYYFGDEEEKSKKQVLYALRNLTISIGTMYGVPVRQLEKMRKVIEGQEEEITLSRKQE